MLTLLTLPGDCNFSSLPKQFVELSLLYPLTGAGNVMFPFSFAIRFNLAFSPQAASSIFHLPVSSPAVFSSISLCPYSITSYLFHHLTMVLSSMRWNKSLTSGQINSFPSIYMRQAVTLHIANIWLQSNITLALQFTRNPSLEECRKLSSISHGSKSCTCSVNMSATVPSLIGCVYVLVCLIIVHVCVCVQNILHHALKLHWQWESIQNE